MAQYLLLPSLAGLSERHPRLHVELEVSDRLADLARDGIDIAIRTIALPDTMVARRVGTLGRALYAAPPTWTRRRAGRPEALRGHRLIVNSAAPQLNHWPFIVDGKPFELVAEGFWRTNDTGLAANMVLRGPGIGRLATVPPSRWCAPAGWCRCCPASSTCSSCRSMRWSRARASACRRSAPASTTGRSGLAAVLQRRIAESEYPCASSGRSRDASRSARA
jgi:DNA-binding transcriptional LysR family regulator